MANEDMPIEETALTPLEQLRQDKKAQDLIDADRVARLEQYQAVKASEVNDEGPGFFLEAGRAVWGAAVDLASETAALAVDIAAANASIDEVNILGYAQATGKDLATAQSELAEATSSAAKLVNTDIRDFADEIAPANESFVGGATRGVLTFVTPYVGWAKAAGSAKTIASATARGFAIDAGLFDPNEGNLSNLIAELKPETQDTVLTFLATDPDDDEALNRLKNGLEGVVLGSVLEVVFKTARHFRGAKQVDEAFAAADANPTKILDETELDEIAAAREAEVKPEPEATPEVKPDDTPEVPVEAADEVTPEVQPKDAPEDITAPGAPVEPLERPASVFKRTLRDSMEVSPEATARMNKALLEGDEEGVTQLLQTDFNSATIDWDNMTDPDSIREILNATAEVFAEQIDQVKGGVQTHQQTKTLANLVGATGDQVQNLFKDVRGDKGIAARMLAAKRTMFASVRELQRLRAVAKANPGDAAARAAFIKQVHMHGAIQAHVKGAQAEIARALNAMKIIADEAPTGFKEFDETIRGITAGADVKGGIDFEKYMDDMLDGKSLEEINATVREMSTKERISAIFGEYVINAMLSSPKTHVLNFTSNALNTVIYTMDRAIAGLGRAAMGDMKGFREAKMDLAHKISNIGEAARMARKAFREGAPLTDKRQRLELQTRKAIQSNGEGMLADLINGLGNIVRIPGRFLVGGDEFFKVINNQTEIMVQAYRAADELAIAAKLKPGTKEYEDFVNAKIKELADPENATQAARDIRSRAIEKARLVTFQETPRTEIAPKMESLLNANIFAKLIIAPFFRTPMNILRQGVLDRSPLGLFLKDTRQALAAGTKAERAEIIARMTTAPAFALSLTPFIGTDEDAEIQITGKVAYDSSKKLSGIQDYSIKIGDSWYQYNRLDPVGMWLGMVADGMQFAQEGDEEGAFLYLQAAAVGFIRNSFDKTWARSVSEIIDGLDQIAQGGEASAKRAGAQLVSSNLGKMIPRISVSAADIGNAVMGDNEKEAYETWSFVEKMTRSLPGDDKELPTKHDILGRPMTRRNNLSDSFSPFAHSEGVANVVESEFFRLNMTIRPLPKSLSNGLIELDARDYSKLTGLVGTVPVIGGRNLADSLEYVMNGEKYQEANDAMKAYMVRQYVNIARKSARLQFLNDPNLSEKYKAARMGEIEALFAPQ